jgi:hypothetical protein
MWFGHSVSWGGMIFGALIFGALMILFGAG